MPPVTSEKQITLEQGDLDALYDLSLKGYRFLTCRHLSMLYYKSESTCCERMAEFHEAGLVTRLFIPVTDGEKNEAIYALTRPGARELARLKGISQLGLAATRKPSYLFLEHGLRISDFMCSLEAALKHSGNHLLSWRSERQLKPAKVKTLRVSHPFESGKKSPIIPDGLFSLDMGEKVEHFCLEADRGTMSVFAMRKKLLGYIQLYRKNLHRSYFGVPHFRVLLITNTPYRRDKLREILGHLGYCPNMFWFTIWRDISPQKILGKIWLKCRDNIRHSLLE